jgi:hypothetical protein
MEFLNKKEEVIDLVLTRRGRELFSVEGFNPHYYAFFDDEVLYDKAFGSDHAANLEEKQNETELRIRNAVTLKTQCEWTASLAGTEKNYAGRGPDFRYNNHWFKPLGKSSNFKSYKPAWNIQVAEGYISGSAAIATDAGAKATYPTAGKLTGGDVIGNVIPSVKFIPFEEDRMIKAGAVEEWRQEYFGERIPQIQLYCDYVTLSSVDLPSIIAKLRENKKILASDEYAVLQKRSSDNFVFSIKEENVDESDSENFTLEIFEYDYEYGTNADDDTPRLKRLYFSSEEHTSETVEYYFNVITDKDVDEKLNIKYIYDSSALTSPTLPGGECG